MVAIEGTAQAAAVAALLFDAVDRPDAEALAALSVQTSEFGVTGAGDAATGSVELLRDGLIFDLGGLAPGRPLTTEAAANTVSLPRDFAVPALDALLLAPGPHLAGAEHLLPVVRGAAGLLCQLSQLPGVKAVVWLPARLAMPPVWFAEAVGIWLAGGPFPALALTALTRSPTSVTSEGLAFFIGQEFRLTGADGTLREQDARIAVRLTDWLVAHGRVDGPREVVLAGAGPVWLEPDGRGMIAARRL